jgi:hypothetical protein
VHDVSFLQHAKAVTIVLANLSKQPDPVQTLLYFSSNIPKFVKTLDFNNTKLNNNGLALLKHLSDLRHLSISNCKYLDVQGLKYIEDLPRLRSLDISKCSQFSSNSIKDLLQHLPKLRKLNASDTNLNDSCMDIIAHMSRLIHANFSRTKITDQAVITMTSKSSKLSRLSTIIATGISITSSSISRWSELLSLTSLNLSATRLDEIGLYTLEQNLRAQSNVLNVNTIGSRLEISRTSEPKKFNLPASTDYEEAVKTFVLNQKDPLASPKSKTLTSVLCFDDMWQGSTTQQGANQMLSEQLDLSDTTLVDYKSPSLNVDPLWQPDFSFVKRRIFVRSPNKSIDHVNTALPVRTYDDAVRKIDFECLKEHIQKENATSVNSSKEKEDKSLSVDIDMKENVENNSIVDHTNITAEEAKRLKKKRKRQKEKERKRKKRKLMQEQAMNLNTTSNMNNITTIPDVTVR